jgi:hypothetical protein
MGATNAERQRRYIARLKAQAAQAAVSNGVGKIKPNPATERELHGKLMNAMHEIDGLNRKLAAACKSEPDQVRALREEIDALKKRLVRADASAKATQTKAAKAALDPDSDAARQIKGLLTQTQTLRRKLKSLTGILEAKGYAMPSETRKALEWVLHPDQRRNATEAQWDKACKLWNAWKDTMDRAHRKDR